MKPTEIKISMTEFVNFINASGMAKMTIVSNAKLKHEEEDSNPFDYWRDFKDEVKKQLKRQGNKDDLKELVEKVREDVRENYNVMINGFLKFWKPTRMTWIRPVSRVASIGGVKLIVNPEIGIQWQNKEYMIKLFLKANENLDKRHADIILAMMEKELRDRVGENVEFAILDVRRGKLFTYINADARLLILLKSEARELADMWKEL